MKMKEMDQGSSETSFLFPFLSSINNTCDKYSLKIENSNMLTTKKNNISKNKTPSLLRLKKTILEKKRRDKLAECIQDLASIVPIVSNAEKKINKTGILRLSASYLKLHNGLVKHLTSSNGWRPPLSNGDEWQTLLQSAVGGFLVIIKECGQVLYVSDGVKSTLGHSVEDIIGQSFYSFVHHDDCENVKTNIDEVFHEGFLSKRCNIFCSMQCSNNYLSTISQYEPVRLLGYLKTVVKSGSSSQKDGTKFEKHFVGVVKLCNIKPFRGLELDQNLRFYCGTATLDGHLLQIDPQFSLILGHLPSEMIGVSGYDLIFHEDILLSLIAHRQMLLGSDVCTFVFRLLTRNNTLVFCISVMKIISSSNGRGKPEHSSFCMSVISDEQGERILAFMRKRLTPYVGIKGLIQLSDILRTFEKGKDTDYLMSMMGIEIEKRPRGRPRKIATNQNVNFEPDFMSWVRDFEVNESSAPVVRAACKQILQKEVKHLLDSYEYSHQNIC